MKKLTWVLSAAAVFGAVQMALAGDVTGKVKLKGTPPVPPQMPLSKDPFCSKVAPADAPMPWYVVDKDGGLADVFVYVKEGISGTSQPPAQPGVLDQKGCQYFPYVIGIQAGQKLLVKNSDPLLHNVHPQPSVAGNKESNMAQAPGSKPLEYTFPNSEVFLKFKCDVHGWMFAYVGVVPHPYFAVSGKDGSFKIPNLPPGDYVIEAIHRKTHPGGKGVSQKVKVGADGAKVDFTIELPAQ